MMNEYPHTGDVIYREYNGIAYDGGETSLPYALIEAGQIIRFFPTAILAKDDYERRKRHKPLMLLPSQF